MLYHLLTWLDEIYRFPGGRLIEYITFRAGIAVILSLFISLIWGRRIIRYLRKLQIGESVRDLGLTGQKEKEGTPTMGGVIIVMAILIPTLLVARLDNVYVLLMVLSTIWMSSIGFLDDYIKVFKKNKEGLSGKFKILGQVVLGLVVGLVMLYSDQVVVRMDYEEAEAKKLEIIHVTEMQSPDYPDQVIEYAYVKTTMTNVPFLKANQFDYKQLIWFLGDNATSLVWIIFIPIVIFIVTAVSNAANLTDGLDGLATSVSAVIGAALGILAYISGNSVAANYLNIFYLPYTGELMIFMAAFMGACIGFLWYNSYPAQVFMGDTGSLTLGGIIGAMAILIRKELLIPVLCGIFLVENLSVVLQVSYFKYTKKKYGEGRRIFKMAPLHHHFQKSGMHEAKIVVRFTIIGMVLAILTLITLKIR
jgi:phospho-N-acetylmuramoyl-pentapeptide-transferase